MEIKIIKTDYIKKDHEMIDQIFKVWLYSFRMNMTDEEYWKLDENETIEQVENHYNEKKRYFIEKELEDNIYSVSIKEDNHIIGHLFLIQEESNMVIASLGIIHDYRLKGYAKKLILGTINFVRKEYPNLRLISYIKPDNIASLKTHKSLGFVGDESIINDFDSILFEYII